MKEGEKEKKKRQRWAREWGKIRRSLFFFV